MNLLSDVDKCLQANITALEHCGRVLGRDLPYTDIYDTNINLKPYIANFQAIQVRFRDLREEAKALRDGVSLKITKLEHGSYN
jgi:hypothetical protein